MLQDVVELRENNWIGQVAKRNGFGSLSIWDKQTSTSNLEWHV